MNYSFKLCLCISMLISMSSFGMMRQINHDENGFSVFDGIEERQVKSYDVDPMLRKMQVHQVRDFLNHGGKIRASRLDNGDYVVRPYIDGKGGGPILGFFAAVGTAVIGTATTLVATVASIPAAGPGCVAVFVEGMAFTAKATTAVAVTTFAAPTP